MTGRSRKPSSRPRRTSTALFIGQWIRALGHRPVDVVRATGINEGYLSELIAGRKKNPSAVVLLENATFLNIPIQYLFRPPPDQKFLQEAAAIDPAVLAKLRGTHH